VNCSVNTFPKKPDNVTATTIEELLYVSYSVRADVIRKENLLESSELLSKVRSEKVASLGGRMPLNTKLRHLRCCGMRYQAVHIEDTGNLLIAIVNCTLHEFATAL
jgi:hypothetical protein